MGLPAYDGESRLLRVGTANDRLKAGRQLRLHRSIVASVLIHVAVILAWPETILPTLASGGAAATGPLELLTLGSLIPSGPARGSMASVIEEGQPEEEEEPGEGDTGDDEAGAGEGAPQGWEGRSEEFWRLAGLRPRVADPVHEPELEGNDPSDSGEEEASHGESHEGIRIREGTDDLAYQRLSEEEILSLERLSALRPELVLVSPSSWLVVRNPREVGAFLRERFDHHGIDAVTGGSLSVSLWVDERGSVEWAEISRSSGHEATDASAIELFREIVAFRPAREEGSRVPVAAIFWLMW